jgi:hypothetical protein
MPTKSIISAALERYGIPEWMEPYIYEYAKSDPANAIKRASSFIEVKRKRGEVNGRYIKLPNGMTFKMGSVVHILSLLYYYESNLADMRRDWIRHYVHGQNFEYNAYLESMSDISEKRMLAVKNLIEGLNYSIGKPSPEVIEVFRYVRGIEGNYYDKVIAMNLILRDAYARPFGFVFYKVFYPVAPEFMRSFGKAFGRVNGQSDWGFDEAMRLIKEGQISPERLVSLAENVLCRTCNSINAEMKLAAEAGIEREAKMLRDISVAYPLQDLKSLGVPIDVESEVKKITDMSESLADGSKKKN